MRVLFIVHGFPPRSTGGTEIYARALARALRAQGHEVAVLARVADRTRPECEVTTEIVDSIPVTWINNTFLHAASFADTYRNATIDSFAAKVLDEFRPDVAHVHHLTCLSTGIVGLCRQRSVPAILTLQDYWLLCHRGQLLDLDLARCAGPSADRCAACAGFAAASSPAIGRLARTLRKAERRLPAGIAAAERRLLSRAARMARPAGASGETARRLEEARAVWSAATVLLAPSNTLYDQFARFGAPLVKMRRQHQGIDLRAFAGLERQPSDRLRIAFLGSLMVSKAPHLLVEAAAGLPADRIAVTIAGAPVGYHGDDSYLARLEELRGRPDIEWRGPVWHDQVAAFLASIDVLVVPSVWIENSPFVIREAQAAGVVVVASNLGGMAEAVSDGGDGLLFEPGSSADLRRVLARLLDEPGLLEGLRRGIGPVRSIEEDADWTSRVYEEVLADASRRRRAVPAPPSVGGVLVNYRTPDDTFLAARSLQASRRRVAPLIVVDNDAATSGPALAAGRAAVRVVRTGRNLGFSGGCNFGIRRVLDEGAQFVFLLNSDAVVAPDTVGLLEDALAADPRAGIAGPLIVSRSEPGHVASAALSFSPRSGRMRQVGFGRRAEDLRGRAVSTVAAVSGCAMLVRRETFEQAGLFDERYFYSFEDIEFCWRAARAGWETLLVPSALVYHEGAGSIGRGSSAPLYFAARNHQLLAASIAPLPAPASWLRALSIVLLNAAYAVRVPGVNAAAALRAVAMGTIDHARRRYGAGRTDAA